MRTKAKVDANHALILKDLRKMGYCVYSCHQMGKGFPDILVGAFGRNFLFEIKDGDKVPSARKLTDQQIEFFATWRGQVNVVTTAVEAHEIIQRHFKGTWIVEDKL